MSGTTGGGGDEREEGDAVGARRLLLAAAAAAGRNQEGGRRAVPHRWPPPSPGVPPAYKSTLRSSCTSLNSITQYHTPSCTQLRSQPSRRGFHSTMKWSTS